MYRRIRIVADSNIPFLEGVFEPYADISYIDGKDITREDITNADVMIIRTRTRCNRELLHGTKVSLIATATIGTDHIDIQYCRDQGLQRTGMQRRRSHAVCVLRTLRDSFAQRNKA